MLGARNGKRIGKTYAIVVKNAEEINKTTALVWFQNNLRVQDNTSLAEATQKYTQVVGVYFFDLSIYTSTMHGFPKIGKYRARFLIESIKNLKDLLAKLNIPLLVYHESPQNIIPGLLQDLNVQEVFLQNEWTREEHSLLEKVQNVSPKNVKWSSYYDQFLFHPKEVPFSIDNLPNVFTAFRKKIEKKVNVRPLVFVKEDNHVLKTLPKTNLPTLKDLGFENFNTDSRTAFPFQGGATAAHKRLQNYFWDSQKLSQYKKTRNGLIGTDYSSKLSAWLSCGCISARQVYHEVKAYEQEIEKNESTYWLIFELIWRDFFKYISLKHQNDIFKIGGILKKEYEWKQNSELLQQWINGETKSSFVNANMLEIKHTGWMSNRGRQNVASYFAKTMEMDWRLGAAYFESMLIDYDVHSNYGNWMYVAGVGNDPRNRTFNVERQAAHYDRNGSFQRHWLQEKLPL